MLEVADLHVWWTCSKIQPFCWCFSICTMRYSPPWSAAVALLSMLQGTRRAIKCDIDTLSDGGAHGYCQTLESRWYSSSIWMGSSHKWHHAIGTDGSWRIWQVAGVLCTLEQVGTFLKIRMPKKPFLAYSWEGGYLIPAFSPCDTMLCLVCDWLVELLCTILCMPFFILFSFLSLLPYQFGYFIPQFAYFISLDARHMLCNVTERIQKALVCI